VPEHRLKALAPLGGATPKVDRFENLTITEFTGAALASVASRVGKEKPCATAAKKVLGVALPSVGKMASRGVFNAFWSGPEQWFVEAPFETHEDLAAILKAGLKATASVTEQTDGWCRFDVEGQGAVKVFERLCPVNIRTMESDTVTRTAIDHTGCFLLCRTAGEAFSVYGPRSSAGSLHHALTTAAVSAL